MIKQSADFGKNDPASCNFIFFILSYFIACDEKKYNFYLICGKIKQMILLPKAGPVLLI